MAGTPLSVVSPYIPAGTREYLFVPAGGIANIQSPTRNELEAGTNLTGGIADYAGFSKSADNVDAPNLGSRFVPQIVGQIKPADSSVTFNANVSSDDIRSVLPQDTAGFIVVFPEGDGPANGGTGTLMDVWPVKVGAESDQSKSTDVAQRTVDFAITAEPAVNVEIPAAS